VVRDAERIYTGRNQKKVIDEVSAIVAEQKTMNGRGNLIITPNISVYKNDNYEFKIGKFYRSGNDDVYVGFKYTRRF